VCKADAGRLHGCRVFAGRVPGGGRRRPGKLPPFWVKSNLTLPLSAGSESSVGALGFNTTRAERDWPDALVHRLQLVAQVFASALARKRADQALQESEELNRVTFEQAAVGVAHVGTDGRWLKVNDKLCTIVGYQREELLKLSFHDITHPEDLETDLNFVRQVLSGENQSLHDEARAKCGDQECDKVRPKWFHTRSPTLSRLR
jgi:PAS domain S-box-containing protein